jgi:putative ABC transport system ATP-binding protein
MILEMSNIYKNYIQGNMDVPVLKDINFSVEEGEYVAIMGPSGSGKSTLMNIIGCLDQATSGTYLLDGKAIENYSDRELARVRNEYIGFVFQTFNLLPKQSALDNVALPLQYAGVPKRQRKERCLSALAMVGLEDRVDFKPTQLSGGQKQRVAIARAMINDPKILLADEPTGALDSKSGVQVMELFSQLHEQGKTIIMITHSEEIAGYADRVIKIIDGEIYEDGNKTVSGTADLSGAVNENYSPADVYAENGEVTK